MNECSNERKEERVNDFNNISTCLELFNTWRLMYHIHCSFMFTYLFVKYFAHNHINYKSFLNRFNWSIYGTQTDTTTLSQSEPGSISNKGVLMHFPDLQNWIGLFGFYGISTLVGYLMTNPLYTCYIWFINA